jgi:hypothetical protein
MQVRQPPQLTLKGDKMKNNTDVPAIDLSTSEGFLEAVKEATVHLREDGCGFDLPVDEDALVLELIKEGKKINGQIARLTAFKAEIDKRSAAHLMHGDEGSQSYYKGRFKVTVTAGYRYAVNKEEYEIMKSHLPRRFDPVTTKTEYVINKEVFREAERYCDEKELEVFYSIFSKKPSKINVKIGDAV